MTVIHIIVLLVTGTFVGFASGLLGIGGGFIMAPAQYFVFLDMGIPPDTAIKLAFGTNLLVILFTAISSTWRHHREAAVLWKAAIVMGGFSFLAAMGGATLATHLPEAALRITFGAVALLSALRMLASRLPAAAEEPRSNPWLWAGWAILIGLVTGMLGIGGGVVAVPVMVLVLRFKMRNAVATSLAMMIFSSVGGVIGYIVNGIGEPNLPAYSLGYVNLQSWLLLVITSVGMAQLGAIAAHRMPDKYLKYIFIVLLCYVGLKMIGLFDWLGWPI